MRCKQIKKKLLHFSPYFITFLVAGISDKKSNKMKNVIFSYKDIGVIAITSLFMDRWSYGRADGRFLRTDIYVASHQHNNYISGKIATQEQMFAT